MIVNADSHSTSAVRVIQPGGRSRIVRVLEEQKINEIPSDRENYLPGLVRAERDRLNFRPLRPSPGKKGSFCHAQSDRLASHHQAFLLFLPRLAATAVVVVVALGLRRRRRPPHPPAGIPAEGRDQPGEPVCPGRPRRNPRHRRHHRPGTLGIDVSALVAGLGLAGLAIGLCLKEIISNVFAGIMVIIYKPFKENDHIAVTTFEGRVSEINLRYTTLEAGQQRIFVPNAMVISNAVVVNKRRRAAGRQPKLKYRDSESTFRPVSLYPALFAHADGDGVGGGVGAAVRDAHQEFDDAELLDQVRTPPRKATTGRPPGSLRISTSRQEMPRRQPVPRAFTMASLAAQRPAKCCVDCRRLWQ